MTTVTKLGGISLKKKKKHKEESLGKSFQYGGEVKE